MSVTVGTAVYELGLDPSRYYEGMEQARRDAAAFGRDIEASLRGTRLPTVTVKVDDRALTKLNQHIELKRTHIRDVNQWMQSNPLTVRVNFKQLDELDRRLTRLRSGNVGVSVSGGGTSPRTSNSDAKLADDIGRAVAKHSKGGVAGAIGSVAKVPLQIAGSAAGSIASGLTLGLTQELTKDLGKGITTAIEGAIGKSVGSSELLGEKLAEVVGRAFTAGLKEAIGASAVDEMRSALKEAAGALVGEQDALFESASRARRRSLSRQAQRDPAREQLQTERRDLLRERTGLRDRMAARQADLESLPQRRERLQARANQLQSQVFDQTLAARSAPANQQAQVRAQLKATQAQYAEAMQALNILPDLEESLLRDLQQLERDLAANGDRIKQANSRLQAVAPEPMPKAYRDAVRKVAGRNLREDQMPQLQIADAELARRGSRATYDISTNTIKVTKELHDALHDNRLEAEQLVSVLHELSHAADFGFGSFKGERAFDDRTMLRTPVQPTPEELKKVAPLISKYSEDLQPIELNAEVSARRAAKEMLSSQMQARQQLVQIQQTAGLQAQRDALTQSGKEAMLLGRGVNVQSRGQIKTLRSAATKVGTDLNAQIQPFEEALAILDKQAAGIVQQLGQLDDLSPDDLRALEGAIEAQMADLGEFANAFARFRREAAKELRSAEAKAKTPVQMPVVLPQKQAELVPVEVQPSQQQQQTAAIQKRSRGELQASGRERAKQIAFQAGQTAGKVAAAAGSAAQTALAEAQKIEAAFVRLYGGLQEAIKEGNRSLINQYGQALQEMADSSKGTLGELAKTMQAEGAKFGDSAFARINGLKGQLTRKQNLASRAVAKFNRENPNEDKQLDQLALTSNPLIEGARQQARSAINKLNALIAKQYEVEMRSSLPETLSSAVRSPKGIAQVKDLAVNTAGFAASKGLEQFGIAPELAGDLIGALAMRQAINVGGAAAKGIGSAVNDPTFKAGNALEKFATLVDRINGELMSAQFSQMQSEELFGDIAGFGIGNFVAKAGEAAGVGIPMKGAVAAMATVPRLATLRERINERLAADDEKSLDRLDLSKPNGGRLTDDQRSALKEIAKLLEEAERHADEFDAAFQTLNQKTLKEFNQSSEGLERVANGMFAVGKEAKSTSGAIGLLGLGLKALLAFQVASFLVPQIVAIGTAVVDAAQSLEQLESQFDSALGASGSAGLEAATNAAIDLKVNLDQARQTYLQFASATQGTPLESLAGDGAESLLMAARTRGLSADRLQRAQVAITQIAEKGGAVSSEEIRGQLNEALGGSGGIAARAMGLSPGEFSARLQQGDIQAQEFLPKFFAQLEAESAIGAASALNTTAASAENLNTQMRLLQETAGKPLLPLKKMGLDAAAGAIELIRSQIGTLVTVLTGAAAAATVKFTLSIAGATAGMNLFNLSLLAGKKSLAILGALLKSPATGFAGLTVGIVGAIEVTKLFTTAFSDLGGTASEVADQLKKAREEVKNLKDEAEGGSGDTGRTLLEDSILGSILGKNNAAAFERWSQDRLRDLFGGRSFNIGGMEITPGYRFGQAEADQRVIARSRATDESNQTISEILSQVQAAKGGSGAINRIRSLDAQLRNLQTSRGMLAPGDSDGRRGIDSQIREISRQRDAAYEDIGKLIARNNLAIEGFKKLRDEAEKAGDVAGVEQLSAQIEAAQKAQELLNNALGDAIRSLQIVNAAYERINGTLQENNQQISIGAANLRTAIAGTDYTSGQREFAGTLAQLTELQARLEANNQSIREMQELLADTETTRVLTSAGFDSNSSPAAVREKAATMPESPDRDRLEAAAGQMESIRSMQAESAQLGQQIAEATQGAQQRLKDLTRQVSDFYRGLSRQTQEIQQTIASLKLEAEFARTKTAINRSLGRFRDTFFDELIGGVEQIADLMNQMSQIPAQAAQQIAQLQNQMADAQLQGQDLRNQLPNGTAMPADGSGSGQGRSGVGAATGSAMRSGLYTGPAHRIGGSSEYHIDTKFSRDLSLDQMVALFDQMAAGYRAQGRQIEFSNAAVAGQVYNEQAAMEERRALLDRALNAHHSQERDRRNGVRSVDYYIPRRGENRFGSSVEGAEILLPNVAGGRVSYQTGGGYGHFATVTGSNGQMVMMTGHGDSGRALPQNRTIAAQPAQVPSPRTPAPSSGGNLESRIAQAVALAIPDLKQSEGFRSRPYDDGVGVRTIGYGETNPSIVGRGYISEPEAARLMSERVVRDFLRPALNLIPQATRQQLTPGQMAAIGSFSYNTGVGGFRQSSFGQALIRGDIAGAQAALPTSMIMPGSNVEAGLRNRRQRELKLFTMGAGTGSAGGGGGFANPNGTVQNAGLIDRGLADLNASTNQQIGAIGQNATAQSELLVQQLTTLLGNLGQGIATAGREIDGSAIEQRRSAQRAQFDAMEQTPAVQLSRELFDLRSQQEDLTRNSGLERLRRSQSALEASVPQLQARRQAALDQGMPASVIAEFDKLLSQVQERTSANAQAEQQITEAIEGQSEAIQAQIKLREEQYRRSQAQAVFEAQQRNFATNRQIVGQRIQGMRSRPYDFDALQQAATAEFDVRSAELMSQQEAQLRDYQEQLRQLNLQQDVMPTAETQAQIDLINEAIARTQELNAVTLDNYRSEFEQTTRSIELQRRELEKQISQAELAPFRERSSGLRAMGFETQARSIDRELAVADVYAQLSDRLSEIHSMSGLSAEAMQRMTDAAYSLAGVQLDNVSNQFSLMGQLLPGIQQGFQGFFTNLLTGSQNLSEAFKGLVDTILNQLATLASQMLVNEIFGSILGVGGSPAAGMAGGGGGVLQAAAGLMGAFSGGIPGFKDGGLVTAGGSGNARGMAALRQGDHPIASALRAVAQQQAIARALAKEGPKGRIIAATEGELILTTAQTRRFFELGYDREIMNFKSGGIVGGGAMRLSAGRSAQPVMVNVPVTVQGVQGNDRIDANRLGNSIRSAIIAEINNQKRPGGALY